VKEFVRWLYRENKKFLFLTNASGNPPESCRRSSGRWALMWTRATFTPAPWRPQSFSAGSSGLQRLVIGDPGLFSALHDVGITINDKNPIMGLSVRRSITTSPVSAGPCAM
jgi:NagD protein